MKNEITWNGMRITLDYQPQPDNYGESVAWYAEGHDAEGNRYEVVWQYQEPEYWKDLSNEEKINWSNFENSIVDDFADWDHPLEVNEQ